MYIIRKTLKGRKQTNMEGGESGTYLRLARASFSPRVSVAKTYRDENETKMNISGQTQRPSSAEEGLCVWAEVFIFVSFSSLYVLATLTRGPDDSSSVLGKCRSVPLPYLFVCFLPFKVFLIIYKYERERGLFLSWNMCLKWLNGRAPVHKTGDLRFKPQLRHKFFSQYLSEIFLFELSKLKLL